MTRREWRKKEIVYVLERSPRVLSACTDVWKNTTQKLRNSSRIFCSMYVILSSTSQLSENTMLPYMWLVIRQFVLLGRNYVFATTYKWIPCLLSQNGTQLLCALLNRMYVEKWMEILSVFSLDDVISLSSPSHTFWDINFASCFATNLKNTQWTFICPITTRKLLQISRRNWIFFENSTNRIYFLHFSLFSFLTTNILS